MKRSERVPKLIRKMAMILSCAMMVQTFTPLTAVYARETVDIKDQDANAKGNISTSIRFDYPFAYKKVKSQDIKVSLKKGNSSIVEIQLGAKPEVAKNLGNYPVEIVAKNVHDVEMTTEDVIGSYYINIKDLELGTYNFVYEGEGYKTYTTEDIIISDYSKNVTVGTGDATFSYGDINGDQKVTEDDLKEIEQNIKDGIHDHDINGDDKVDIVELTYVKQQLEAKGEEVQTDLAAIISQSVMVSVDESIKDAGLEIADGNSVADLFTGETQVKIQKTSDEGKLEIPINLGDKGIEAQVIELVSPVAEGGLEGGTVIVEYEENGETKREIQTFGSSVEGYKGIRYTGRSEDKNKIVINLGKRVPVKRVTVSVDKVVGEDGNPSYVVMEEVSFVKDIASNVSPNDKTAIKNVILTEENEAITLEWDPVPNVEGYRVFYGEKSGEYTGELNVDEARATVKGLENLTPYYFMIRATSEDWMGTPSEEYRGIPQPSEKPLPPDFLKVEEMNGGLKLNWGKTDNATYYKVFYKEASADDIEYKQFIPAGSEDGKIVATSAAIGGLKNDVEYNLYVVAGNNIGESNRSLVVTGTPEKVTLEGPILPSKNRIDVSEIEDVKLAVPSNVDETFYPNGFNLEYNLNDTKDGIKNVVDNDYATHWTAKDWWVSGRIDFTFKTPHEMNYVVFVPRVDDPKYTNTLTRYHITVWEEGDDLSGPGKEIITDKTRQLRTDKDGRAYAVFEFPKTKVKKIGVRGRMRDGGPALHSASEIAFYDYYSVDEEIKLLFADDAFTTLAPDVTKEDIDAIRAKLKDEDSYYVDSTILADELNLAEALLAKDTSKLGMIKNDFVSIDASKDVKRINDWSPLGLVGYAGKKVTIYADIPEGEKIEIIPTQYYSEANSLSGTSIELVNGRNIIEIERITNLQVTRGGSLYYRYSGNKGDQIKLHIRDTEGAVKEIPTLELYNWYELSETERKARISKYIDDLVAYAPNKLNNKDTNPANSTEISGRNILLSLPADQVLAGITAATPDKDAQIEKLYNNMLAWEEVIKVTHTTYGLDNPLDVLKSRQNIRYMRMFANAFMYAAGSHIGVGYGSTGALVQGKPTSVTGEGNANGLFGWGIAHEIGHNMDRLGKAEITNNIYSLMMQTYDGKDNMLPSRLELSDKYQDIYKKVAVGDKGMSNDGFTQLGMYWQLHLAYDNGADDKANGPLSFYNKLFKVYDSGKVNGFTGDDKFAVAASMAAEKDLTEFFTKWGMDLSDAAKAEMKNYSQEERKIQYLTDESRRYRLNGGTGIQDMEFDATASVADLSEGESNANKVKITIRSDKSIKEDLLGYEIFRDGKQIAFITDTTYEDVIGSANNKAFKYEVRAIDSLGNIVNADVNNGKVNAGQVRIEHDNVIDRSQYRIEFVGGDALTTTGPALTTTGPALILSFNKKTLVTGIRVKAKNNSTLPEGTFEIAVGKKAGDGYNYLTAKEGDFEFNEAADASKFITYFNKPGASSKDTRIWTYDADVIRITGENIDEDFLSQFDVEPLSYPGDNVAFEDYKVGIMGQDYEYDDVDGVSAIEEGTLVIVGTYRGDPLYNTIHIVGRYAEKSGLDEEMTYVERPINGELLMFAEVPEDGETSDISDGLFIFIPDVQKEEELQGDCSQLSVLPTEIMAKMYRYDTIEHTGTPRVTSTTLWYGTPSYDSMPEIILNQGATSLIQEDMYEEN